MMIRHQPIGRQTFIVVFHDRLLPVRRWWHFLTKPGFYHCFVMKAAKAGTIIFQPLRGTWFLDWVPKDAPNCCAELLKDPRYKVLVVDRPGDASYNRAGPIHCVNVVKACLGVKSRAVTPYQLYRDLLQMGAVEILI